MKKVKFDKKLSLNKETVSKLNAEQMNNVKGGEDAVEARPLSWFRCCRTCSGTSMGSYCVDAN